MSVLREERLRWWIIRYFDLFYGPLQYVFKQIRETKRKNKRKWKYQWGTLFLFLLFLMCFLFWLQSIKVSVLLFTQQTLIAHASNESFQFSNQVRSMDNHSVTTRDCQDLLIKCIFHIVSVPLFYMYLYMNWINKSHIDLICDNCEIYAIHSHNIDCDFIFRERTMWQRPAWNIKLLVRQWDVVNKWSLIINTYISVIYVIYTISPTPYLKQRKWRILIQVIHQHHWVSGSLFWVTLCSYSSASQHFCWQYYEFICCKITQMNVWWQHVCILSVVQPM